MPGKLWIVGTPIGNLGDISPRALETLSGADFIAAEDTRVTSKLLSRYNINKELVSYYEHNKHISGKRIAGRILGGESCALVTDAGMPAISDPGEDLVGLCVEQGIEVRVVPGPCAAVSALALSALPGGRFTFEGFLSTTRKVRMDHLNSLKDERRTMIFYEAPHKLCRTLADLRDAFGPGRSIALCRELTKIHEEVLRTTLGEAVKYYEDNRPRGEFVLVIGGAPEKSGPEMPPERALEVLLRYRDEGCSLPEAAKRAAADTGCSKKELYDLAVRAEKN